MLCSAVNVVPYSSGYLTFSWKNWIEIFSWVQKSKKQRFGFFPSAQSLLKVCSFLQKVKTTVIFLIKKMLNFLKQ